MQIHIQRIWGVQSIRNNYINMTQYLGNMKSLKKNPTISGGESPTYKNNVLMKFQEGIASSFYIISY